jgi:DNA-binding MarR family transcriptional regulator
MVAPNPLFLRDSELDRSLELILLAERELTSNASPALRRLNLSPADLRALHVVAKRPGITPVELARRLGVSKQAVSRQVAMLARSGQIERLDHQSDARKLTLRLSQTGQAQLDEVLELQRRRLRQAFKRAGAEAVEGFGRVLGALAEEGPRRLAQREAA